VTHTRLNFWKEPQYTKSGMWWFTLFFGFFGLHHFLLRSPQTGLIFLICNMLTCGYLWCYDLIQLSKEGGADIEELNKHGLSHAFGALGLAQGMWKNDTTPEKTGASPGIQIGGGKPPKKDDPPPNPYYFLAYALLIPISPVAQYLAGDNWTSFLRLLYITIIPFGTLLYFFSIISDYWTLFSQPSSLFFTMNKHNLEPFIDTPPCPPADNIITTLLRITLPILRFISPGLANLIESMIKTKDEIITSVRVVKEDVIEAGLEKAQQVTNVVNKVGRLATEIPVAVTAPLAQAARAATNPMALLEEQQKQITRTMVGGALVSDKTYNPLEYLTLGTLATVMGGGLLLGINRSLTRYSVTGKDDSPPDAGRV
jgi:hypothetical protein